MIAQSLGTSFSGCDHLILKPGDGIELTITMVYQWLVRLAPVQKMSSSNLDGTFYPKGDGGVGSYWPFRHPYEWHKHILQMIIEIQSHLGGNAEHGLPDPQYTLQTE